MELITSKSNEKIALAARLLQSAAARREYGLFVLEGARLCSDAAAGNAEIIRCFATPRAQEKYPELLAVIRGKALENYEITDEAAKRLSDTDSPQGIICVCKTLDKNNKCNKIDYNGKYMALDNLQDPANLGAVARTAEALGLSGLIVAGGCDVFNPKAQRAAMGSLLRIGVTQTDSLPALLADAGEHGMLTAAAVPDSDAVKVNRLAFTGGTVCVVGNEGNGVSSEVAAACSVRVTIPMAGAAESLNAAAAAAILMWEMVR